MPLADRLSAALQSQWWQSRPRWPAQLLRPLALLVQVLSRWHRWRQSGPQRHTVFSVPVIVVGNLIVGGAGKTPTAIALLQWLQSRGWHPGLVSRGYGRLGDQPLDVDRGVCARAGGDEPLLIHLRTGVPVRVGRDRLQVAKDLVVSHPEVDILVSDDGLQHWRLPRDLQILVFDHRGTGNGLTLPAGPLRQPLPRQVPPRTLVLYNADRPSTPLPGSVARRGLAGAQPLQDWWSGGSPSAAVLRDLAARSQAAPLLAAAGMAEPERFFSMLETAGVHIVRLPLPDHADFAERRWPAGTPELLLTEKDAVKLIPGQVGGTRIWVVTLDFQLPPDFTDALTRALPRRSPLQ